MKKLQILNIIGLVIMLALNGLANALPMNGVTTGDVSDNIPSLFTPAAYVFAIWGVIYLGVTFFTIYQALPAQKENQRIERIGIWFFISSLLNGLWIIFWHYGQFLITMIIMIALLISLIIIYVRAGIGKTKPQLTEKLAIDIPFGIYLGWISVATIANAANLLIVIGWDGFGIPILLTVVMLAIGMLLGLAMIRLRKEVAFPLVLIWAYAGILVKRMDIPAVAISAGIAIIVLLAALFLSVFKLKVVKVEEVCE
jgi:hypothetical protein